MRTIKNYFAILTLFCVLQVQAQQQLPGLKVSPNHRFFVTSTGEPFFWLGDTGWLLFSKATREEARYYLDTRAAQGYNVVQVMLLHELSIRNVYGDTALVNGNVAAPRVTEGNDSTNATAYDYWDHVNYIIDEAAKRGIYMALVPIWGGNVKSGKVSTSQATDYAKFLAEKFRNKPNIIWLNGGDIRGSEGIEIWQVLGATLKKEMPDHLVTFHPRGRTSSSEWFHKAAWLDFNMFQSGHKTYAQDTSSKEQHHYGEDNWRYVLTDYNLFPLKPTIDGEPSYENIPHGLHDSLQPRWTASDLRRYAYWSVFAGAAGFTYGENAVMQFNTRGDADANFGVTHNWKEAVHAAGATQMKYLKQLMLSKPFTSARPAQDILAGNYGSKYNYQLALKGQGFAMVYTYTGRIVSVKKASLGFNPSKASWFRPSTGEVITAGKVSKGPLVSFDPPGKEQAGNDWVLILE